MASQNLDIIINLKDRATETIRKFNGELAKSKKTSQELAGEFRNVGIKMTALGGAITAGFAVAVNHAANAEGAFAKFNTVFGEGADEMLEFVNDIRTRMPVATGEIVRMSADLQDLLVPLGLSRDKGAELTQGFVELANQLAAFNDVDPTEVLEAFKSGLSGSSEPLRRFGINALETSLEARALQDGLLAAGQSFKDLDPTIKNQIRAQALLSQAIDNSADAINGFEENNDSFIRRSQDLRATIKEMSTDIGKILLPIVDDVTKKIKPVVKQFKEWADANPELAKRIVVAVAAIGALMVTLGPLLIMLPGLISAFGLLSAAIGLISLPVVLTVAAIAGLIAIGVALVKNWDAIRQKTSEVWGAFTSMISEKVNEAKEAVNSAMTSMREIVSSVMESISGFITAVWDGIVQATKFAVALLVGLVIEKFNKMGIDIVAVLTTMMDTISGIWTATKEFFTELLNSLLESVGVFSDAVFKKWKTTWNSVSTFFAQKWVELKGMVSSGMQAMSELIASFTEPISEAWGKVMESAGKVIDSAYDKIKQGLTATVNFIISEINKLIASVNDVASTGASVVGIDIPSIPEIPMLANGGIVTKPTLAMVGEAGPEAVIPLNKANGMGAGGVIIHQHIEGSVIQENRLIDFIGDELTRRQMLSSAIVGS